MLLDLARLSVGRRAPSAGNTNVPSQVASRAASQITAHVPSAAEFHECNITYRQVVRIVRFIGRQILISYAKWAPPQPERTGRTAAAGNNRLQINLDLTDAGLWNRTLNYGAVEGKKQRKDLANKNEPTMEWVKPNDGDKAPNPDDIVHHRMFAVAIFKFFADQEFAGGAACDWLSRRLFGDDSDVLVRAYIANGSNGMVLRVGSRSRSGENALKVIPVAGNAKAHDDAMDSVRNEITVQLAFAKRGLAVEVSRNIESYRSQSAAYRVDYSPNNDDETVQVVASRPLKLACVRMGLIHTVLGSWLTLRVWARPTIRKLSFGIARLLIRGMEVGLQGDLHTDNLGIVVPAFGAKFDDKNENLSDAAVGNRPVMVGGVGRLVLLDFGFGEVDTGKRDFPRLKDWLRFLSRLFLDWSETKYLEPPSEPRPAEEEEEGQEVFFDPRKSAGKNRAARQEARETREAWNSYTNSVALQHEMLDRFIESGLVPETMTVIERTGHDHRINPAEIVAASRLLTPI